MDESEGKTFGRKLRHVDSLNLEAGNLSTAGSAHTLAAASDSVFFSFIYFLFKKIIELNRIYYMNRMIAGG